MYNLYVIVLVISISNIGILPQLFILWTIIMDTTITISVDISSGIDYSN